MEGQSRERWRLILGETGAHDEAPELSGDAKGWDETLSLLYNESKGRGLNDSSPMVHRWLGDIRRYFPSPVVQLLQRDALERLGLRRMLLEPELLDLVEPNAHLIATLISLSKVIPDQSRESARILVRRYTDELLRRLRVPMVQKIRGSLYRLRQTRRPKPFEIDWSRTIRANLRHYQPEWKTIIPHQLLGRRRSSRQLKQLILLADQSGSMATSVVHAGILGSVLASIPSLDTRLIAFDTQVVDLSTYLSDPVDLLFATQLGGGTHIAQALAYARTLIGAPRHCVLVLLSDLMEGAPPEQMLAHLSAIHESGVTVVGLLSLNDDGAPAYDHHMAAELAAMHIPVFACTPDRFPDLMAAALGQRDLQAFAAGEKGLTKKN